MHNEHNKAEQEHFSQKRVQENFLLNRKAHAKIQALLKGKNYPKKSLTTILHQAIQLLIVAEEEINFVGKPNFLIIFYLILTKNVFF